MNTIYFERRYGDAKAIPIALAEVADDGTISPLSIAGFVFSVSQIKAGFLKTASNYTVAPATPDEYASITVADKASYSWLVFHITGEVGPRAPSTLVRKEYRIRTDAGGGDPLSQTLVLLAGIET